MQSVYERIHFVDKVQLAALLSQAAKLRLTARHKLESVHAPSLHRAFYGFRRGG
jgi:hypothetical protein